MITQKVLNKSLENIEQIAKEAEIDTEVAKRVIQAIESDISRRRRRPAPPPPNGGISLSEAERRYGIPNGTLSRWAKKGWLHIIGKTKNKVYISDAELSKLNEVYKKNAGRGSWVIKKMFDATVA